METYKICGVKHIIFNTAWLAIFCIVCVLQLDGLLSLALGLSLFGVLCLASIFNIVQAARFGSGRAKLYSWCELILSVAGIFWAIY